MSLLSRVCLVSSVGLLLVGCASTTIYPEAHGNYSLVTTSSDQGTAEKDAQKKADEYCTNMGKRLVVVDHKTVYQGADKTSVAILDVAGAVLAHGGGAGHSNQDYQVTMKFKCQ